MKIKLKMPNYVTFGPDSCCISNLNHMLIIHAKYTQNYCIFTPNSFFVWLYLDCQNVLASRWNNRNMLFCMQFFHHDALCPNRISETMVKHCQNGHLDGEKWFDVPDHRDMVLYIG